MQNRKLLIILAAVITMPMMCSAIPLMIVISVALHPQTTVLIIITLVVFLLVIWAMVLHNNFVIGRNRCDESWSNVDTELKRRYDLIPNLVDAVKGYAVHEKDVLERVIRARDTASASTGSPGAQARDENALVGGLHQLLAIVESYPVLKADANFSHLQKELINTEDRIQGARRFYNDNVRDYNSSVQFFPSNIFASVFSFQSRQFFEIDAAVREPVKVSL